MVATPSFAGNTTGNGNQVTTAKAGFPQENIRKWTLGVQGGVTAMFADADKIKPGFGGGLNLKYSLGHSFAIRGVFNYMILNGETKENNDPNTQNFESKANVMEGSLQMVYMLGNISFLKKSRNVIFYPFLGIGYYGTTTNRKFTNASNTKIDEDVKSDQLMIPFGLGMDFRLGDLCDLSVEYGVRYAFDDNLDGLNRPTQGNRSNDIYSMLQVGLNFKLGKKTDKHVEWMNPVATLYDQMDTIQDKMDRMSQDTDKDGVSDFFDQDSKTPAGANVYGNGKAEDSDGDGVPNISDKDPYSPKGATVDAEGVPTDSDNDGVADAKDISPNTDTALMVNFQGVPIMTKSLARELANGGGVGGLGYLPAVMFDFNSSKLKPVNILEIQNIANALSANKGLKLTIIGNADERGSNKFNDKLALKRADAVKQALVEQGIDAARLTTKSNGETVPVVKGRNASSYQVNRRVQFFLTK